MQTLLLLHGAIGTSDQLSRLADVLSTNYKVHTISFTGHGGKAFTDEPFSMQLFANDILSFLEKEHVEQASVFGYSMGGYAAMYLAKKYPGKINKLITLATKYHWDNEVAAKETQMLIPGKIEQKIPAFAQALQQRHHPNDWKEVLNRTSEMMLSLGKDNPLKPDDYRGIEIPVLLMLGDRDKMVGFDETTTVYKALPNAQMAILPNTSHPIEQVDNELLSFHIKRFL